MAGPRLEIELLANMVRLQSDMGRAVQTVEGAMGKMQSASAGFSNALATIGVGVSLGGLVSQFQAITKQMDDLNDMADKTGQSIESLSAIGNALAPFGHTLDTIGTATDRLVKSMQGADEETKGAGQAFAALGVQTRDATGNLRPAVDVLYDVAGALAQYSDGANKTALAQAIFGKSGGELLPVLKDLAEAGRGVASVTTEMAAESEKYQRSLATLSNQFGIFKQGIVGSVLPGLNSMIEQFNLARRAGLGLVDALNTIAGNSGDKVGQINAQVKAIGVLEARIGRLQERERKGQWNISSIADLQADLAERQRNLAVLRQQGAAQGVGVFEADFPEYRHPTTGLPNAPALPKIDTAGASKAAAAANKAKAEAERIVKAGQDAIVDAQRRLAELDTQFGAQTAHDKMLFETSKGRYAELGAAVKEQLVGYSKQEDAFKRMEESRKRFLANEERIAAREYDMGAEMQRIADETQRRAFADQDRLRGMRPGSAMAEQIAFVDRMYSEGAIASLSEYQAIQAEIFGQANKNVNVYDQLGSAIEDAFDNGAIKDFGSAIDDLGKRIQQIFYREFVTEPLMRQIKGFIADIQKQIGGGASSGGGSSGIISAIISGVGNVFGAASSSGSWLSDGGSGLALSAPGAGLKSATPSVNISQTLYTDARSDVAVIQGAMQQAKDAAVTEVMRGLRSGGPMQRLN